MREELREKKEEIREKKAVRRIGYVEGRKLLGGGWE